MVKSFLLKNAIKKHNQHTYKLVRATENKKPHADERAKITDDKPLPLTTVFQHDSFDLHFFVNGLLNFS